MLGVKGISEKGSPSRQQAPLHLGSLFAKTAAKSSSAEPWYHDGTMSRLAAGGIVRAMTSWGLVWGTTPAVP